MQLVVLLSLSSRRRSRVQLHADGWGPSWLGGNEPGVRNRPDLTSPVTAMAVSGAGIGTEFGSGGDVGNMEPITPTNCVINFAFTQERRAGKSPWNAAIPSGIAPKVCRRIGGKDWRGLEGAVDVYRRDLSE